MLPSSTCITVTYYLYILFLSRALEEKRDLDDGDDDDDDDGNDGDDDVEDGYG